MNVRDVGSVNFLGIYFSRKYLSAGFLLVFVSFISLTAPVPNWRRKFELLSNVLTVQLHLEVENCVNLIFRQTIPLTTHYFFRIWQYSTDTH